MSDSSKTITSFSESENDLETKVNCLTTELENLKINTLENTQTNYIPQPSTSLIQTEDKSTMAVAIPPFLKVHAETIPDFDGDTNELQFFLESVDSVVQNFYDFKNKDNYQNVVIFRTIISKLKGSAREVVNISGASTIGDIKKELITHFSDPRNENCLSFDLNNLRQLPNESACNFYDIVRKHLNTISNYLAIHEKHAEIRQLKQNMYNSQALQVFLAGLREPYGTMVRTKDPQTMLDAINFIKQEQNIRYFQKAHNNIPLHQFKRSQSKFIPLSSNKNNYEIKDSFYRQPSLVINHHNQPFLNQNTSEIPNPNPKPNFPTGPVSIKQRPYTKQNLPTHSQVFGKPKNVWKPSANRYQNQPKPTPMSTMSRQTNSSKMDVDEFYNTEHINNIEPDFLPHDEENETEYEYNDTDEAEDLQNFPLDPQDEIPT